MKRKLRVLCAYFLNPHFLVCFFLGWMITNGWAYLFLIIGAVVNCPSLIAVGTAYLTILWLPFTPEKIVTVFIAMKLQRKLFPEDGKAAELLEVLRRKNAPEH